MLNINARKKITRVEKVCGRTLRCSGDTAAVTIYDIRGRRIFSGPVKGRTLDLRVCGTKAESVYIVEWPLENR